MSHPVPQYHHLSPEAPGTEPAGFDSAAVPEGLSAIELEMLRDLLSRASRGVHELGGTREQSAGDYCPVFDCETEVYPNEESDQPGPLAVFYRRVDAALFAVAPAYFPRLLAALAAAEARAVQAEARVRGLKQELAEQERAKLLLIQETHRWSEAEKRDKQRHQEELDGLKNLLRVSESFREAYRKAKLLLYEAAFDNEPMLDALLQLMPCSEGALERAATKALGGRTKAASTLEPATQQPEGGQPA